MALMAINPEAAALAKRLAAKTGRRASDIYKYAAPLLEDGMERQKVEEALTELCEIGEGLSLDQIIEMAAEI